MRAAHHRERFSRLRRARGLIAACMVLVYVLAGALHGLCDLDVTSPAGKSVTLSVPAGKSATADAAGVVAHHCHGCFSVALSAPALVATASRRPAMVTPDRPLLRAGIAPSVASPPPKHLT